MNEIFVGETGVYGRRRSRGKYLEGCNSASAPMKTVRGRSMQENVLRT